MELLFKSAAAALSAAVFGLLLRRKNPELTSLLIFSAFAVLLIASLRWAMPFRELSETVRTMTDGKETLLAPVLKCVAAAVVTQITADLCRDASQSALASAAELTGTLFALGLSMPLIVSMLKMLGGLL